MKADDKRVHLRTTMNARVKVVHESLGEAVFATRDISDGGVFIEVEGDYALRIGDLVQVQVQGLPIPAPVLSMVVVRAVGDGFGLKFVD